MRLNQLFASLLLVAQIVGCAPHAPTESSSHGAPARIDRATSLSELSTVVLTSAAERALAIEVKPVERFELPRSLTVGGEVMVVPGQDVVLTASVAGRIAPQAVLARPGETVRAGQLLVRLVPMAPVDRDLRPRASRDVAVARADSALALVRVARAEAMVADRSGSQRALDEARAQQSVTAASLAAAIARVRSLANSTLDSDVSLVIRSPVTGVVRGVRVTMGQSVPQGAPMFEIAAEGRCVRASFLASEALQAERAIDAQATQLGTDTSVALVPTVGPPTADAVRATVDRFYALPDTHHWTPGERVLVSVKIPSTTATLSVAVGSVVRDAEGGAWVYERVAAQSYRRRRVRSLQMVTW